MCTETPHIIKFCQHEYMTTAVKLSGGSGWHGGAAGIRLLSRTAPLDFVSVHPFGYREWWAFGVFLHLGFICIALLSFFVFSPISSTYIMNESWIILRPWCHPSSHTMLQEEFFIYHFWMMKQSSERIKWCLLLPQGLRPTILHRPFWKSCSKDKQFLIIC